MKKTIVVIGCLLVFVLTACTSNAAYKNNTIVTQEEINAFVKNVSNKTEDTVQITSYTTEGDPIYHELKSKKDGIHYQYDNTNDTYAGSDSGVYEDICKEIVQNHSEIVLSKCSSGKSHMIISP